MARPEKTAVVDEVRERLQGTNAAVLTEYRGLGVAELAQLRARLRESDAEYKVVKNTLTRLAARDAGVDIPDDLLTGPTAITFCAGDPVAAAKVLRNFSREHPALVLKGGLFEGRVLGAEETLRLAELQTRDEMLSRLAGMFQTIVAQPARLAQANLSKAARLFAALQEQRGPESDGSPSAEPEAAGDAPEASGDATEAPTES